MTRHEAISALIAAGWPAVADDLHDVSAAVVLRRLREVGEGDSEAAEIVALVDDDD